MDPNQAWEDLGTAIEDDDWRKAEELAQGLLDWIDKGGFVPRVTGKPAFDKLIVQNVCNSILSWEVA